MYPNRRRNNRIYISCPIEISFGEQVSIQGKIRDLSQKSAFINIGNSIYIERNDKFNFKITLPDDGSIQTIAGEARVSRIAPGEGVAIYFTQMDEESEKLLAQLIAEIKQ